MVRVLIDVNSDVCKWLKSIGVIPGESYESILSRLLDCKLGRNLCEYTVSNARSFYGVNLLVDWDELNPNLLFSLNDDYSTEFPINPCVDYESWNDFKEKVQGVNDIFSILVILECNERIVFDDLIFTRIK